MSTPQDICIHVCVTCRGAGHEDGAVRPGAVLHEALKQALSSPDAPAVRLEAVECLSVCKRPCTVAVSGPDRWTYVYGDLDPTTATDTIIDGVRRYMATSDGLVPWRERPEAFRKGVVARIPPFKASSAA